MIYTDYIHVIADSVAELHCFANNFGIKKCWFDSNPKHPHYDLPKHKKADMLTEVRAKRVEHKTTRELILIIERSISLAKLGELLGKRSVPTYPTVMYVTPEQSRKLDEAIKQSYGSGRETIK